jgi:ankyrin repeat protein
MIEKGDNNYPVELDWKGLDDWAPLHFACYEGNDDVVDLLCQNGANINSVTKYNRNGLHIASLRGHTPVIEALVKHKIDWNAFDTDGNTALHFAAENGYKDIIQILLDAGCNITKNKEGLTPIHDAISP